MANIAFFGLGAMGNRLSVYDLPQARLRFKDLKLAQGRID